MVLAKDQEIFSDPAPFTVAIRFSGAKGGPADDSTATGKRVLVLIVTNTYHRMLFE